MKYVGSKAAIVKQIMPIILAERKPGMPYVEPFVGGGNAIEAVPGRRTGYDSNKYVIALLRAIRDGWELPYISKTAYQSIKSDPDRYPAKLVGWAGIGCSYSGKWFGGYAGKVETQGGTRDYIDEAIRNAAIQRPKLIGCKFFHRDYQKIEFSQPSLIYCDPPYAGTLKYKDDFDSRAFYEWCELRANEGHVVFVSEYDAPACWKTVWSRQVGSSLSANGSVGGRKTSTEKLFRV